MSKNLKNFLLWNQKADDIETWCAVSSTWDYRMCWWPWVDTDLFYGNVKFDSSCFCMGKTWGKTIDFSETIVVYDIKAGRCSQPNEYMKLYEYQRSRSFIDIRPRSLRFNIFKLFFFKKRYADWSQISYEASMGWGNESEYKWFMSHDQDSRHVHIS